ncbi:hypothetical protein DSO57_1034979 [Entomophthora muscae]|uniref:Uncharacterized protein n=1 Tax=Entomophthora muscae TaxID=34485 RepID=A0ACC2UKE4_9FUNG|nr:hypothetical protein DSO57_1034979 [Entomophthora muscae]
MDSPAAPQPALSAKRLPIRHHMSHRDVSAPEPLNRPMALRPSLSPAGVRTGLSPLSDNLGSPPSSSRSIHTPSASRPNLGPLEHRPNLSPAGARPNLSPLALGHSGAINRPTPINMVDRLTPRTEEVQTPQSSFKYFMSRLSPKSLFFSLRRDLNSGSLNNTTLTQRESGPTYDERAQPFFQRGTRNASEYMNSLLASNPPPPTPSPVMRRFRSFTPKLLKSGVPRLTKESKRQSPSVELPKPKSKPKPQAFSKQPTALEKLPKEILETIFSYLSSPRDMIVCTLTCQLWRYPAQNVLNRLMKYRPYAGLPMLKSLRMCLRKSNVSMKSSSLLHDVISQLTSDYYLCNPYIYSKFFPKTPEIMVNHLFWIFLFLDREFRSTSRRRVSCNRFIKLIHLGILDDIDKETLKALYQDIKSEPLIPEGDSTDSPDENTMALPPLPRRRWWHFFQGRGLEDDGLELSDEEEDDPFRPLN